MNIIRIDDPNNRLQAQIKTILGTASFDDTRILELCTQIDLFKLPYMGSDRVEGVKAWLQCYDLSLRQSGETVYTAARRVYGSLDAVPMALMIVRVREPYRPYITQLTKYVNTVKRSQTGQPSAYVTYGDIAYKGIGFLRLLNCTDDAIIVVQEQLHEFGLVANN